MSKANAIASIKNLSENPKVQERIDEQLRGYNDALRRVPFNPNESSDYRYGWQAKHDGRVLTDRALQYLMR